MGKLYQINEDDLRKLEVGMPILHDRMGTVLNDPMVQAVLEEVKTILSNVRWNYGPHTHVEVIPAGDPEDA